MRKSVKATLVSATLAASLLLSSTGVFAFSDVDAGHWAAGDIERLSSMGYINGYEDGTFAPSNFITRAEFVTIINKVKGASATSGKTFVDVSTDAWYAGEIDKAVTAGYITGYDDGTVRPDACISRAEVAVVCYKAWGLTPEGTLSFTDSNKIGSWAKSQIATLVAKNVLSGYEDGSFRPDDAVTRAEVAKIVSRLMDMKNSTTTTTTTNTINKTPAGLSNTSVVIGSSSSSGGGGGSSSSSTSLTTAKTKALEDFLDGDVDVEEVSDYATSLKNAISYANVSGATVNKNLVELYDAALSELFDAMADEYDGLEMDDKTDAKEVSKDMASVVLAVNKAVKEVKTLAKDEELTYDNLVDFAEELEEAIEDSAKNPDEVYDLVFDFCTDLADKFSDMFDELNGESLSDQDIVDIYNGDYEADDKDDDKEDPSSKQTTAMEGVVGGEEATVSEIKNIVDYSDNAVTVDKDVVDLYNVAINELVNEIDYSKLDLDTSDAEELANDVAAVVEVVNEAVAKVQELAKDSKLDYDNLLAFADELETVAGSAKNENEVYNVVYDFAVDLYSKVADKLEEYNGETLTEKEIIDIYNSVK